MGGPDGGDAADDTDAVGGACEFAVAVAGDSNSRSHSGRTGTGHDCPHSCRTDVCILGDGRGRGGKASRITITHGEWSLGASSNPHPPTGYIPRRCMGSMPDPHAPTGRPRWGHWNAFKGMGCMLCLMGRLHVIPCGIAAEPRVRKPPMDVGMA